MSSKAHVFIGALALLIEINAHAARVTIPTVREPTQEPKNCLSSSAVCAIRTPENGKFTLLIGQTQVILDAETTLVRNTETSMTLIAGTVWIRSNSPVTVATEFGAVESQAGEFWVRRNEKQVWASAIDGVIVLNGKGGKATMRVQPGEENWLGGVGTDGQATSGVPRAIAFDEHVARWARLYPGIKTEFEADLRAFHARWSRQLASVADYHRQLAESRLKVLDEENAKKAQAKAQYEARSRELRALFRRKNYLD